MTPERKAELEERWQKCERQLQAIHAGKVVDGGPADWKGSCSNCRMPLSMSWGWSIS
jgi:hypothetical protein